MASSISLNAVKNGSFIKIDGQPFVVINTQHSHVGRGGATLKVKMKNLLNDNVIEKTFQGNDKLEPAGTEMKKASFLYTDEENAFFMDSESYEQFGFSKENLGTQVGYLKEGLEVDILYFEDKPAGVQLPKKVALKVTMAPPAVRGDTAQGSVSKQVTLETGITINAPIFIKEGDVIKINTEKNEYSERI